MPTQVLKVLRDLVKDCGAVTRADQKAMKRAVSVSFVKVRSKVDALAATHKEALEKLNAAPEGEDEDEDSMKWDSEDDSYVCDVVVAGS